MPNTMISNTSIFARSLFLFFHFLETVKAFIDLIQSSLKEKDAESKSLKGETDRSMPSATDDDVTMDMDKDEPEIAAPDEPPFPPTYESGEDYDKAGDAKQEAADLKSAGELEKALEKYNEAVVAAPPSALLYANRATVLLQLNRLRAAERDCNLALSENPDSAKALRVRGKVYKELGKYEEALKDLSASQAIDFDEGTVEDLKFVSQMHVEKEKLDAEKRVKKEEKLRKRAEDIKKAQEDARREEAERARGGGGAFDDMPNMGGMPGGMGGMPGGMGMGGMPGGMGGMPGGMDGMEGMMAGLMSDPELMAEMQLFFFHMHL